IRWSMSRSAGGSGRFSIAHSCKCKSRYHSPRGRLRCSKDRPGNSCISSSPHVNLVVLRYSTLQFKPCAPSVSKVGTGRSDGKLDESNEFVVLAPETRALKPHNLWD